MYQSSNCQESKFNIGETNKKDLDERTTYKTVVPPGTHRIEKIRGKNLNRNSELEKLWSQKVTATTRDTAPPLAEMPPPPFPQVLQSPNGALCCLNQPAFRQHWALAIQSPGSASWSTELDREGQTNRSRGWSKTSSKLLKKFYSIWQIYFTVTFLFKYVRTEAINEKHKSLNMY